MGDRALSLAPNREGMNLKNPPTLADACIATAFTKDRLFGIYGKANYTTLMRIPYARKFVLDATMSRYLADLSENILSGGIRKRNIMFENIGKMARLPHTETWIEFDFLTRCQPRAITLSC